jgi:hypothetical protein
MTVPDLAAGLTACISSVTPNRRTINRRRRDRYASHDGYQNAIRGVDRRAGHNARHNASHTMGSSVLHRASPRVGRNAIRRAARYASRDVDRNANRSPRRRVPAQLLPATLSSPTWRLLASPVSSSSKFSAVDIGRGELTLATCSSLYFVRCLLFVA